MIIWINLILDILFAYLAMGVLYIAIFAVSASLWQGKRYAKVSPKLRFRILFPAYKEDRVICDSALSAVQQDYPKELFSVCVIADHMQDSTIQQLENMGAEVLQLQVEESSKAKALTIAMEQAIAESSDYTDYDYVVILDADNVVPDNYLREVNDYLNATQEKVLQTHRTAKNLNTSTAILDAAIEEINNSIFRTGHIQLGISSSLIGSGMVIDYPWFASHIALASTAGEDKELEEMMLREHIHIGYAPHIPVYDEKVQQPEAMRRQRRRWLATQLMLAKVMWRHVGKALCHGNTDYVLKAIETVIPPRSLLMVLLVILTLLALPFSPVRAFIGVVLWLALMASLYIAIPRELKGRRLWEAMQRIPSFLGIMISNLFHLHGAASKFIHTHHG
jgi:cellulose synthase/poly-beta-1,6-N-acetylglucosamine synthase-like glycosyltransferase